MVARPESGEWRQTKENSGDEKQRRPTTASSRWHLGGFVRRNSIRNRFIRVHRCSIPKRAWRSVSRGGKCAESNCTARTRLPREFVDAVCLTQSAQRARFWRMRATSPVITCGGSASKAGILLRPLRITSAICSSVTCACQSARVKSGARNMGPCGPSPRPTGP